MKALVFSVISNSIHSYGGGDHLEKVFEAISRILYGEGTTGLEQTFHALLRIALIVGGFSALVLAFLRQKFAPLIQNFLIPGFIIVGFLLIPRTTLEFGKEKKSIEVPFFLGKLASWTTFSFHHLYQIFEKAVNTQSHWTANIYHNHNFFLRTPFPDPSLDAELREFCKECVFRDIGLGLYSKKELSEAPDLFAFLENHTSQQRGVYSKGKLISCQDAIQSLRKRTASYALDAQPPFKDCHSALAQQKMMVDILQEEIFGPESKNQKSIWASGVTVLMDLRTFFEALLYLIFPLIVLLSLLSFGIKTALLWIRTLIWVYTWPIFYLAIDLFLDTLWNFRGGNVSFTLENASHLSDLYSFMEMLACITLSCVPFISWLLIKGGSSQLAHVSASLSHETPTKKEPDAPHHNVQNIPQDVPRQTSWGILAPEAKISDNGFKEIIENSKLEERIHSLQGSLSTIRNSIHDSAEEISKAVKDSSQAMQNKIATNEPPSPTYEKEDWGGSRMHIPAHGSWGTSPRDPS